MKHNNVCPCNKSIKDQIRFFIPLIQKIKKTKNLEKRRKLIEQAPKCLTNFFSSCAGAILRRDIELSPKQYKKLSKFKNELIFLSNPRSSLSNKTTHFLDKKGGFLSLIPILGGILANTVLPLIIKKISGN